MRLGRSLHFSQQELVKLCYLCHPTTYTHTHTVTYFLEASYRVLSSMVRQSVEVEENEINCCVFFRYRHHGYVTEETWFFGKVKRKVLPSLWRMVSCCMWRTLPSSFLCVSLFELSNNPGRSFSLVLFLKAAGSEVWVAWHIGDSRVENSGPMISPPNLWLLTLHLVSPHSSVPR